MSNTRKHPENSATIGDLLTLGQAAKLVPTSSGKGVSTATLWRWCSKGVHGCKLRHYRFGKRICVTAADLLAFGEDVAEAKRMIEEEQESMAIQYQKRPRVRSAAQRERDIEAAIQYLRKKGIMV